MTDFKVYIDTALFIYYLEKNNNYFYLARNFFLNCYNNEISLVTSVVTTEEYCVFPLSKGNMVSINNFDTFITGMKISLIPVDNSIAFRAAKIRAEYKGFKALDAIHLATAITMNCKTFVSNDKQLRQMKDISVITLDDLA